MFNCELSHDLFLIKKPQNIMIVCVLLLKNMNLIIKTEPYHGWKSCKGTVNVFPVCVIYVTNAGHMYEYTFASAPGLTDQVFMARFFLGQCIQHMNMNALRV